MKEADVFAIDKCFEFFYLVKMVTGDEVTTLSEGGDDYMKINGASRSNKYHSHDLLLGLPQNCKVTHSKVYGD